MTPVAAAVAAVVEALRDSHFSGSQSNEGGQRHDDLIQSQ